MISILCLQENCRLSIFFDKWSKIGTKNPCVVVWTSLLFAIGCMFCVTLMPYETDSNQLYSPFNSQSYKNTLSYSKTWEFLDYEDILPGIFSIILTKYNKDNNNDINVFNKESVKKLLSIHNNIVNFNTTTKNKINSKNINDVCHKDLNNNYKCSFSCFVEYFNFNFDNIDQSFALNDLLIQLSKLDVNISTTLGLDLEMSVLTNYSQFYNYSFRFNELNETIETNISSNINIFTTIDDDDLLNTISTNLILYPVSYSYYTNNFEPVFTRAGQTLSYYNITNYEINQFINLVNLINSFSNITYSNLTLNDINININISQVCILLHIMDYFHTFLFLVLFFYLWSEKTRTTYYTKHN